MAKAAKPTYLELARQALQDIEGGYNLLAPKFDQSRYITPEIILETFFDKLQAERGNDIQAGIDVCCGTGVASKYLLPLCKAQFTALDLSQAMLDQCENKLQQLKSAVPASFIKANALDMPFENDFDVVISFGAFGHILEKEEELFIQQIHKVLKPGGAFYFITTGKFPLWSISLWRQRLFNFLIGVRNALIRPKFIMYYLTFRLPKIKEKLSATGFEVSVLEDVQFEKADPTFKYYIPLKYYKMVKAEKI